MYTVYCIYVCSGGVLKCIFITRTARPWKITRVLEDHACGLRRAAGRS